MTPTGVRLRLPALGAEVLTGLERIARESPSARIEIAQPAMTDVFRRVLDVAGRAPAGGER
jgi:hypothetical protein